MKKALSITLVLAFVLGLMAGCGGSGTQQTGQSSPEAETAEPAQLPAESKATLQESPASSEQGGTETAAGAGIFKSDEPVTFTIFANLNPNMTDLGDPADYNIWKTIEELTNVTFDWQLFSMQTATEQFNLLSAAGSLPELVFGNYWANGDAEAVEEEVYRDIAGLVEECAPDYYSLIQQQNVKRVMYSDEGYLTEFIELGQKEFVPNNGFLIRDDMLEKVGMENPITYDQYHDVLTAFKTELGVEAPLFMSIRNLDSDYQEISAGFGVNLGFCLNDSGELIYGPVTDDFRDFLRLFNKWYSEGLIYQDFFAIPSGENVNYLINYLSNGQSATAFAYCEFADMVQLTDPEGGFGAGYIPRKTEGQQVHLTDGIDKLIKKNEGVHITTNCDEEKAKLACRFFNSFYTEEGALLANYGVEGKTFEYGADGKPWYTDVILNNPDGLTQTQALGSNLFYWIPCYSDYTKYNISSLTKWAGFIDAWSTADNANTLPQFTLTTEEERIYSNAKADVSTYMDETLIKFIIGDLSIDNDWDSYISALKSIGVDDMIDVYQDAYARFLSR